MGETLQQIVRLIDAPSWRSRLGLSLISNFSSERFETFFAPPSCSPFPLLRSILLCPFIVKCVFFHHETCFLSSKSGISPKRTDISPKITEFFGKTTDISPKKTDIFWKISLVFLPSTAKRVAPSFFLLAQLPKAPGFLPFLYENERINRIYAIIMREN